MEPRRREITERGEGMLSQSGSEQENDLRGHGSVHFPKRPGFDPDPDPTPRVDLGSSYVLLIFLYLIGYSNGEIEMIFEHILRYQYLYYIRCN